MTIANIHRIPADIQSEIGLRGEKIAELRILAEQFERMKAAAKEVKAEEQKIAELREEHAAAEQCFVQANASAITVISISRVDPHDTGALVGTHATLEQHGVRSTIPLQSMDAAQQAAVLASGKLPAYVLTLGDTPEAALNRWIVGKQRGYLTA